jgi:hypothetical protein
LLWSEGDENTGVMLLQVDVSIVDSRLIS